mmetsp:Transcript_70058/g.198587  ORF Transcript_70058/g.198587 Transcript_70058/m.198587 type:complete len:228 (+) Transcript_70058:526-1209(+)
MWWRWSSMRERAASRSPTLAGPSASCGCLCALCALCGGCPGCPGEPAPGCFFLRPCSSPSILLSIASRSASLGGGPAADGITWPLLGPDEAGTGAADGPAGPVPAMPSPIGRSRVSIGVSGLGDTICSLNSGILMPPLGPWKAVKRRCISSGLACSPTFLRHALKSSGPTSLSWPFRVISWNACMRPTRANCRCMAERMPLTSWQPHWASSSCSKSPSLTRPALTAW